MVSMVGLSGFNRIAETGEFGVVVRAGAFLHRSSYGKIALFLKDNQTSRRTVFRILLYNG